jgi:hypothetical protein
MNRRSISQKQSSEHRAMRGVVIVIFGLVTVLSATQRSSAGDTGHLGFSHGTVTNVCGPTDGIELLLLLTEKPLQCGQNTPRRYIRLSLDGPFPKTIAFPVKNPRLQAFRCEDTGKGTSAEPAVSGTIRIDKSGHKGHYDLTFKNGAVESGDFQVGQCMSRLICG